MLLNANAPNAPHCDIMSDIVSTPHTYGLAERNSNGWGASKRQHQFAKKKNIHINLECVCGGS